MIQLSERLKDSFLLLGSKQLRHCRTLSHVAAMLQSLFLMAHKLQLLRLEECRP